MKMKLVHVFMGIAAMSVLVKAPPTTRKPTTTTKQWTTAGPQGQNLIGKMFTLSRRSRGITFYPPNFYPASPSPWPHEISTTRPYITTRAPRPTTRAPRPTTRPPRPTTTRPYITTRAPRPTTRAPRPTTTRPYYPTTRPPWTTAPPTRGVSVCLRYVTDYADTTTIFRLSYSSLTMRGDRFGRYEVSTDSYYGYDTLFTNIRFWSNIRPDIWTRVCLTVDSVKNVVQVFRDSYMSPRKIMSSRFVWSGKPVIEFSGFDGQITDVQMWDYPLQYTEVYKYMTKGVYGPFHGSVLTWSSISYSSGSNTVLEDVYEEQARQPISSKRRGRRPKGGKRTRKGFRQREEKKGPQLL